MDKANNLQQPSQFNTMAESNHSVAGSASSNANICFYFRRGECRFGARCRDIHSKPPPSADRPNQTHTFNFDAPEYIPQRVLQNRATEAEAEPEAEAEAETEVDTDQQSTYAQIVKETQCNSDVNQPPKMCPYFNTSGIQNHGNAMCPYGVTCEYYHGDLCEICGVYCLHPKDEEQQRTHKKECMEVLEKDMDYAFGVARSKDKACGICMDVVTDKKATGEHRFGILPNCNHVFCLACIRKWRQAKNLDSKVTRTCPMCRTESHFVCPSQYWVDDKEEKDKLINRYKNALQQQNCKYFNQGKGTCPFGNKCFYKHAMPDGTCIDLGKPQRRRRMNSRGEFDIIEDILLLSFIESREDYDDADFLHPFMSSDDE